ncbi:hypothetical protein ACB092_11G193600 [Castanea dentata]
MNLQRLQTMPSSFSLALCPSTIEHKTILLITVILSYCLSNVLHNKPCEEAAFTQVASIARWDLHHKRSQGKIFSWISLSHLALQKILRCGAARQLNLMKVDRESISDIHATRKFLWLNLPIMEGQLNFKLLPQRKVLFLA